MRNILIFPTGFGLPPISGTFSSVSYYSLFHPAGKPDGSLVKPDFCCILRVRKLTRLLQADLF